MAAKSFWFDTTGGIGDGTSEYTENDHTRWVKVIAACHGERGIGPSYGDKFLATPNPTAGNDRTVRIGTGGAIVDGKPLDQDISEDKTLDATPSVRRDRIVLKTDWAAKTVRITVIKGADGTDVAPAIPADVPGTVAYLPMWQASLDSGGVVTMTDEREYAKVQTAGLADLSVTSDKLASDAVVTAKIENLNVTEGKLANLAVATGKIANLGVTTGKIGDLQVTEGKLANLAVATGKIANLGVTEGKLANGAVTPTKSSFFDSHGASGAIYSGRVASDGSATRVPAGWSSAKLLTGNYRVTHNLGTSNYAVVIVPTGGLFRVLVISSHGTTSFECIIYNSAGAAIDTSFEFIMVRYS